MKKNTTQQDKTYRDMAYLEKSESVLILPFAFGRLLEKKSTFESYLCQYHADRFWEKDEKGVVSSYVYPHVYKDLNEGERFIYKDGTYVFGDGCTLLSDTELRYESYFYNTKGSVIFDRMEVRVFTSGLGMLLIRYRCPESDSNMELINTAANMSHFFMNESRIRFWAGEQEISLVKMVRDVLHNVWLEKEKRWTEVFFFPNTRKCTAYQFHRICDRDFTKTEKYLLGKQLWAIEEETAVFDEQIDVFFENEHRIYLQQDPFREVYGTMYTMSVFSECKLSEELERGIQENVRRSYLNTYLLVLDKHEELLRLHGCMKEVQNSYNKAERLKERLLDYMAVKDYSVISPEENYQNIYETLRKILNIDSMEDNLRNLIFTLQNEHTERRSKILNGAVTIIGFLSVLSAFESGLHLAEAFSGETMPDCGLAIAIVTLVGVAILGYCLWPKIRKLFQR